MGKKEEGSVAALEFDKDTNDSLFDIDINDNAELWLVQLPDDQLTLDLNEDGELGSIKGPNGVVYSLVNFPSDVCETTVFQPTPSGTKIAGKIARHVSLIHYPELNPANGVTKKRMPMSSTTTFTKTRFSTPTRTTIHKSKSSLNRSASSRKNVSETGGSSKAGKLNGRSRQNVDSQPGHSGLTNTTVAGSSEQSHRKKSKMSA